MSDNAVVSDDEVIGYVARYLDSKNMGGVPITSDTSLAALGLDSISMVELLISARSELTAAGRLSPDVALGSMPVMEKVSDLGDLFRGLAAGV